MDSIGILLRTPTGDLWPHDADLTKLSHIELEEVVRKARDATLLLEAELATRGSTIPAIPSDLIRECDTKLQSSLRHIRTHGCLSGRAANSVELAVSTLTSEQTDYRGEAYKQFLNDIIRHCGHEVSLLCAAGIGKFKIVGMNIETRTSLVQYIKRQRATFRCPELDKLVTQHWLPVDTGSRRISYM